jgi:hypothetical protein
LNFARGVAFQAKQRVIPAHADAVISYSNQASPAGPNFDCDASRLSIESVFDQFLDDACRPFDDFARRDLVGDMIGKQSDTIHFLERFNALTF